MLQHATAPLLAVLACFAYTTAFKFKANTPRSFKVDKGLNDDSPKTVYTNTTNYGFNLCHVCTTTVYSCVKSVSKPCPLNWKFGQGNWTLANETSSNSTYHSMFQHNSTHSYREKRWAKRRHRRRRRWNKWNNNDFERSAEFGNNARLTQFDDHDSDTTVTPITGRDNSTNPPEQAHCTYNWTQTCTERRCVMKCCDGSPMNAETNACSYNTGQLDACFNGGTLNSGKTHCACPKGFMGAQCQHLHGSVHDAPRLFPLVGQKLNWLWRVCKPPHRRCSRTVTECCPGMCLIKCRNGGVCQTRNNRTDTNSLAHTTHNDDYCVCPSNTEGRFCEKKKCNLPCVNNGTCTQSYYGSVHCDCPEGFTGELCQKGEKDGACPSSMKLKSCSWRTYRYHCHDDQGCPGKQKCCRNSCHDQICVNPYHDTATCVYRNQTYTLGTAFSPDPCHVCSCNASHVGALQGVIECARIRCPPMSKYCTNVETPEGACCSICREDPDTALCAGNYTYPRIVNCPDRIVTVLVGRNSNQAVVKVDLKARDCRGMPLDVLLSEDVVTAGLGEENYQLLTATSARDSKGNFAECAFHIRIRDPYPPVFQTCPSDVVESQPGPVHWEIPVADDNVGLATQPTSRNHPGDKMAEGQFLVEYWVEDFQGNVAECKFLVTVEKGHFGPDHGHGHHEGHPRLDGHLATDTPTIIGLIVGTSLTVIVLLVLAGFYWRKRQPSHPDPAAVNTSSTSNTTTVNPSLRWDLSPTPRPAPLPQYSVSPSVMSPPLYTRNDEVMVAMASGNQEAGELPSKNSFA